MLMLIAFTSIILGLATTFYLYCKRGLDDSQIAMRLANQRLAFSGALAYTQSLAQLNAADIYAAIHPGHLFAPIVVSLQDSTLARTKRLGWFRVAYADPTYVSTALAGILVSDNTRCVFVTSGVGPSAGLAEPASEKDWQYEIRSWYLVEFNMAGFPARCVNLSAAPPLGAW